ncbi:class I SAM-dependent methyltransferase [Streptomyces sp. CG1]|uniref:class I SAM-dependent methyltransferase n=1 Tax=Streptomyces sp. CG1 TaxID=1287523 RepID=UPI0034E25D37
MQRQAPHSVADAAAVAALLQIGAEIGADQVLDSDETFNASSMAKAADVPIAGVTAYLTALLAAGLIVETEVPGDFKVAADYTDLRYQAGYVSWAMHANGPFIDNAVAFLTDPAEAAQTHQRNGRRVAVSSRWIGERAFYPQIIEQVVAAGALRVTDLGAGAGGLLIKLLNENPGRTGTAVDSNGAACAAAREAALAAGVHDRLTVLERPIESLVRDPGPVAGAEAILACYVMHDIVADDRTARDVLGALRDALAPGGFLAVADAVSYAPQPQERTFSALFTYLHATFMNVSLPTEQEWLEKFEEAGFAQTRTVPTGLPGGRIFVASR